VYNNFVEPAEQRRLDVLHRYAVLDTPPEPVFDELTALAAHVCHTPMAAFGFVDSTRVWFKSRIGLPAGETPRESSLCAAATFSQNLYVVPDTNADPRFDDMPAAVIAGAEVRFYAAVPIVASTGEPLGALCVLDRAPRLITPFQAQALQVIARQIMAQLELRRRTVDLAERERLLWTIVETEPECVKLLGPDGTLRKINRAGLQIIEADSEDEVLGRSIYPLIDPADCEAFRALVEAVFRGEQGGLEFQLTGLKGGRRHLATVAVPLVDTHGAVVALLGITRDITEQKRVDAALRESEQKYRMLFEQATEGIFVTDAHARILDVNPAGCQLTGYSREELIGLEAADLVVPDEVLRLSSEIARLGSGQTVTSEWRMQRKDGAVRDLEVTTKQLPDGRLQGFARDITDRKRAEAALRDSETRLRQAVQAGRVGLWDWNLENDTVYYSPEWKRQIGYEDHEIDNALDEWRCRVHPEDLPGVLERIQAFLCSDEPAFEGEFRFRHKDASYRRILTQGSKVFGPDGRPTHVLGSHVDVTELTELHAQFLHAQKMESVGRLAGGIAHDFNNLLTVINGMAELVVSSLDEHHPIRPGLQEIRLAGDRAARLTRQLLAVSRQQVLQPEVINLTHTVSLMESMLKRLIGEDVTLVFALAEDLDHVRADPGQIEQVILNLAVNARDAMPDGGRLTIETRSVHLDAAFAGEHPGVTPGSHVLLAVTDTGVGMDEVTRKRVFEPFFTTKEQGKGTGLGLPTVYGIVKQSGGTIWPYSEPGKGARFEIYLPRVSSPATSGTPPPGEPVSAGHETILLVEDERALRELTSRILRSAGYTVLEASSGAEALDLLTRPGSHVDLMLTDVVMPGMNGRELAERVTGLRPGVKVLYTSGYTDDAILKHGVLDDERRFIAKPYTPAALKRKVRELLDLRALTDSRP
jgi:PAS domain S-box-containing protein